MSQQTNDKARKRASFFIPKIRFLALALALPGLGACSAIQAGSCVYITGRSLLSYPAEREFWRHFAYFA
jgi:hypothetical protein